MESNYLDELTKITTMPKAEAMKFWDIYHGIIEAGTMEYENAGYSLREDNGNLCLVPINPLTALELYKRGNVGEIYRIYEDGTEGAVYDLRDLILHADDGGMFAIEVY